MKSSLLGRITALVLMSVVIFTLLPKDVFAQFYGAYNSVPVWKDIPYQMVRVGNTLSLTVFAIDDNGDSLNYAAVSLPDGAYFDAPNHLFVFTPRQSQLGTFAATLSVTDNRSQPVYKTFYVGVSDSGSRLVYGGGSLDDYPNQAPYFTGGNSYHQIRSGNTVSFQLTAFDPEGDVIFYRAANLPSGASFNSETGWFQWLPSRSQRGTYNLQFFANDGYLDSAPINVTIVVDNASVIVGQPVSTPASPSLGGSQGGPYFTTSPSLTGTAGQTYVYNAQAFDPYSGQITYALTLAPEGAYLNPSTGVLAWTAPTNAVSAPYRFTITATNNRGLSANQSFDLQIVGGVAKTSTVVRYVNAPAQNYQQPAQQNTHVSQTQYQQASGSAFNLAVRTNASNETIVSWDTLKPSRGEVVFGYNSQPSTRVLNYDFTTGQASEFSTRHEISLGQLDMSRTYYIRVISRTGSETDIASELIVIPMPYSAASGGQVNINDNQSGAYSGGTASASDSLGNGWFLFVLALIIVALAAYLLIERPRRVVLI